MKYYAAASILLPGISLFIWPANRLILAIFAVWVVAAAAYWIKSEKKEHEENIAGTIKAMQNSAIRTLNHHRHDWMNDLQVLYGYIRLQKLDNTVRYVEKISTRMNAESAISRLGEPSLISFIQSFRTISSSLELQVEIKGEIHLDQMSVDAAKIAESLIHTINAYRFAVKPNYGHAAILKLELSTDDEALYAAFYYEGELINEQQWKQKIHQQLEGAPIQPIDKEQTHTRMLLRAAMRA